MKGWGLKAGARKDEGGPPSGRKGGIVVSLPSPGLSTCLAGVTGGRKAVGPSFVMVGCTPSPLPATVIVRVVAVIGPMLPTCWLASALSCCSGGGAADVVCAVQRVGAGGARACINSQRQAIREQGGPRLNAPQGLEMINPALLLFGTTQAARKRAKKKLPVDAWFLLTSTLYGTLGGAGDGAGIGFVIEASQGLGSPGCCLRLTTLWPAKRKAQGRCCPSRGVGHAR